MDWSEKTPVAVNDFRGFYTSRVFGTYPAEGMTMLAEGIAPAIIESCPTRLFLPNERAIEPQITAIYRRFGLNDRQIEILSRATPKRDYYCQSRRGNRLFELGLGGEVPITGLHRLGVASG